MDSPNVSSSGDKNNSIKTRASRMTMVKRGSGLNAGVVLSQNLTEKVTPAQRAASSLNKANAIRLATMLFANYELRIDVQKRMCRAHCASRALREPSRFRPLGATTVGKTAN